MGEGKSLKYLLIKMDDIDQPLGLFNSREEAQIYWGIKHYYGGHRIIVVPEIAIDENLKKKYWKASRAFVKNKSMSSDQFRQTIQNL